MLYSNIKIPKEIEQKWQNILNLLTKLINVPAALIMRVEPPHISVFQTSTSEGNPYKKGAQENFSRTCGLYCETVIRTQCKLLVPNALKDKNWCDNPDIKLNMISYLGFPINDPSTKLPFGTICILDNKENPYNSDAIELLKNYKEIVEDHLLLISTNQKLKNSLDEIKVLRGLIPICSWCKKIRDDDGDWENIEQYIPKQEDAAFTHSICPDCLKTLES